MSRIVLEGVTKQFADGTVAVNSLSLDIGDGELMVLVGPSGCGKTTVLRMVAGLEEVTDGTISIDGEIVNDLDPRHRDIAMVFQSYALYPHLSVYDNMAFSLKYRKTPKDEIRRRVSEAARILELEPYLQRKPRQLSGGQRQRVAMGRAIVRQPRAFLMDEPLSNLDAKLRVQMRAEILKIQQSLNVTTIYVTHDQTEAMTLGDRVAVVLPGRSAAGRDPARALSSTGEPVRRRVHRITGDEPHQGQTCPEPRRVASRGRVRISSAGSARAHLRRESATRASISAGRSCLGSVPRISRMRRWWPLPTRRRSSSSRSTCCEDLGAEVDVHCSGDLLQDTSDVSRTSGRWCRRRTGAKIESRDRRRAHGPSHQAREGDTARIHVDVSELHFFDPDTGETIRT